VMLGRAVFGNPWLFSDADEQAPEVKMSTLIKHIDLFQERMTGFVSDALMKKHFKAYVSGWEGAKDLRVKLMEAPTLADAKAILVKELQVAPGLK